MGRTYTLSCDKCDRVANNRVRIITGHIRRADGIDLSGDLCRECWVGVEREFGFTQREKQTSRFKVEMPVTSQDGFR